MAYSKKKAAKSLGLTKKEFEKKAKKAGFSTTEAYWNSIGGDSAPLQQEIIKQLIALDRQFEELRPLGLTDEEKAQFLEKAIEEIQPYYDRKSKEIEAGIKEGKVRTAEEIILNIREVEAEITNQLARYDLQSAQTEEEFINKIADITATSEEDLGLKRDQWKQRLEDVKVSQIQRGTLTSGIGGIEREEGETTRELELSRIERRAEARSAETTTERKFDVENIRLAREKAEQDRIRRIGDPGQTAATREASRGVLGLEEGQELGSAAEVERLRSERGVSPIFDSSALTDLEERRRIAIESRKLELETGEESVREFESGQQERLILNRRSAKQAELDRLRR